MLALNTLLTPVAWHMLPNLCELPGPASQPASRINILSEPREAALDSESGRHESEPLFCCLLLMLLCISQPLLVGFIP